MGDDRNIQQRVLDDLLSFGDLQRQIGAWVDQFATLPKPVPLAQVRRLIQECENWRTRCDVFEAAARQQSDAGYPELGRRLAAQLTDIDGATSAFREMEEKWLAVEKNAVDTRRKMDEHEIEIRRQIAEMQAERIKKAQEDWTNSKRRW